MSGVDPVSEPMVDALRQMLDTQNLPRGTLLLRLVEGDLVEPDWGGRVDRPSPGRWRVTSAGRRAAA